MRSYMMNAAIENSGGMGQRTRCCASLQMRGCVLNGSDGYQVLRVRYIGGHYVPCPHGLGGGVTAADIRLGRIRHADARSDCLVL
jgi:hypothetical protein